MMRSMRRIVLLVALLTLAVPATANASLQVGSHGPLVSALQRRLVKLTYLAPRARNGYFGLRTEQAVMAFQGWVGLPRDGVVGTATWSRLAKAHVPYPWTRAYRHIEIHLYQQVALLVGKHRKVLRAVHVSTGRPGLPTPSGSFRIYRKEKLSWSVPFQTWMPYANYFYGGYAIHQLDEVPGYPASHGCVRVAPGDSILMWYFATIGTRVLIH
jgi:hypothetical protein